MSTFNSPPLSVDRDSSAAIQPNLLTRVANGIVDAIRPKVPFAAERNKEIVEVPESFKKMVLEFLHICFCLPEEHVPYGVIEAIFNISNKLSPTTEDIKMVIASDTPKSRELLKRGVQNYLLKEGDFELQKDDLVMVIEDLRQQISRLSPDSRMDIGKLLEINSTVRCRVESIIAQEDFGRIGMDRQDAIEDIRTRYPEVVRNWQRNPFALSSAVMACHFVRSDQLIDGVDGLGNRFLSTYFDSSQFGLENELLTKEAVALSRRKMDFMDFMNRRKLAVIRHFEPERCPNLIMQSTDQSLPLRFTRPTENLFCAQNGTRAFELFSDAYINDGDTILTTTQEYGEIMKMLEDKARILKIPDYGDDMKAYKQVIAELLRNNEINYALISELSRHGIPFPLLMLRELLDLHAPNTDLVVDGAQSIGRRLIDFNDVRPSVFFGSIQKGADVGGGPLGVLMLSDEFIDRDRKGLSNKCIEKGTIGPEELSRLVVACTPEALGTLSFAGNGVLKEDLEKMTISVSEREEAINQTAFKFIDAVDAINEKCGNRIKILSPEFIHKDLFKYCLFTCKIDGVTREQVRRIAESHGVTINDYSDEMEPGVSFRISFHPFMSNEDIMILWSVLEQCCSLN